MKVENFFGIEAASVNQDMCVRVCLSRRQSEKRAGTKIVQLVIAREARAVPARSISTSPPYRAVVSQVGWLQVI